MFINAFTLHIGASVEMTNRSGQSPLFCAAYLGHVTIVELLLKSGADPNRRCNIYCCTPVHAACWSGNVNLLKMLLIAGNLFATQINFFFVN